MKPLLALLVLGLALAFGYWKTQNPESTVGDLAASTSNSVGRITSGLSTAIAGGASTTEINERLESIESDLLATQNLADPATINARIDSLEAAFSATQQSSDPAATTNARLESLEAAIVATQQSSDPSVINGRLTDAERRMVAAEEKLTRFKSDMSGTLESIDAASSERDAQTAALDDRLDLLNQRIEEQAQQFNSDSINDSMSALKNDIASLQTNQDALASEQNVKLTGMKEELDNFAARFDTLSAGSANASNDGDTDAVTSSRINAQIDQRLAKLEEKLSNTNADSLRIESLTNELSAARVKLQALERGANDANALIADLTNQLASLSTQSESSSIDGQQTQLRSQLKQLQDQMNESGGAANIAELADTLQATRDRIETLEQRVIDLPATSSAADEATQAQRALQAQIQALESKLSEVQAAPDPNMVDTLNQVEEKVSELAAKSYVTQEELREQQQGKSIEYKIYFEPDSTEITEDAGLVLNSFIAQEKNRSTAVSIYGFTDRIGSATYNQALALQRATNVRSYLIQNGFSYTKIKSLSGLGEDAAANTPDNEEDAQQRTVVLYAQQP